MIKTILLAVLIIYAISITVLFLILRDMFNKYIESTKYEKEIVANTKYNWSKVPDWVNWIATNEGGFGFGFECKPRSAWLCQVFWYDGGKSIFLIWPDENRVKDDWCNSLEERPEAGPKMTNKEKGAEK